MKNFLLEQLQKYIMLFDVTTDQLMAWVGDWQEQVPELYNPNFQIFSVYAFWGANIYLLWAIKKQILAVEEKDRIEELERIFLRAETKAEIATHLFPEKVTSELNSFFNRVTKWWQGEYHQKLKSLKNEEKMPELKLSVAYIFYRREQMFFAALAMEQQGLRGTTKLVADLKSMNEFLVDPAIKSLCQEYRNLFKGDNGDPWYPEEFWWRKMCPFQEDSLSLSVSIEKKKALEEDWLDFLDKNGGSVMKEELWKSLYARASELQRTINRGNEEEWARAKKIAEMSLVVAEETFETGSPNLEKTILLVKSFEAISIKPDDEAKKDDDKEEVYITESAEDILGNHGQIIRYRDEAIRINPNDAEAWNNKGDVLVELGKRSQANECYDEAIKCYDEAIKIDPYDKNAWLKKGEALLKSGKYSQAMESNGVILYILGKYPEAIKCFDEAIRVNPEYAEAWHNKGLALNASGKNSQAIKCFDEAIRINPNYAYAWREKGWILVILEDYSQAIKCFDGAIRINPNDAKAWLRKGSTLFLLRKFSQAIECYDEALKINPDDDTIRDNKDNAVKELERLKENALENDDGIFWDT